MVLKLYMVPASPPVRSVLLTASALGLKLEKILVNLFGGEQYQDEYLKINPQHTVPALDDDGKIICDSHVINTYLVSKYGKDDSLYPKDPYKRAIVDERLYFNNGTIQSASTRFLMPIIRNEIDTVPEEIQETLTDAYGVLDKLLEGKQWSAGDTVTLADFSLISSVTTIATFIPIDEKKFANVTGWIKRAESWPYYAENQVGLDIFKKIFLKRIKPALSSKY